jgi:glycosyltransferase involved in cell wall biosynthesis
VTATSRPDQPRLALLLPDLRGGGAERVTVTLANEAVKRGIATAIGTLRRQGCLERQISPDVAIHNIGASSARTAIFGIRKWLLAYRPQALLVTPSHLGWAASLGAVATGTRVVVREASTLSVDLAMMDRPQRWTRLALEKLLCRSVGRIALSEESAADLSIVLRVPRDGISVVPNPVITSSLWERGAARVASFRKNNAQVTYLTAGRLTHQKGMDMAIRAFAAARSGTSDRLLIAGEGPERQALEALAQGLGVAEQVTLLGYCDDIPDLMLSSSAFVLCSRWEGLPAVLIEALATGVPVVATRAPGGSCSVLEDGRWGLLVAPDNVESIAAAMRKASRRAPQQPDETWRRRYAISDATDRYLDALGLPRWTPEGPRCVA